MAGELPEDDDFSRDSIGPFGDDDSCFTCRFWWRDVSARRETSDEVFSICRRYPPSIKPTYDETYGPDPLDFDSPATTARDWCGEFEPQKKKPDTGLGVLNLGTRVFNGLECSGIETVEKLCTYSARELIRDARNVGRGGVAEIREALAKIGKSLKGD
jgi:hypothetical protein